MYPSWHAYLPTQVGLTKMAQRFFEHLLVDSSLHVYLLLPGATIALWDPLTSSLNDSETSSGGRWLRSCPFLPDLTMRMQSVCSLTRNTTYTGGWMCVTGRTG